MQNQPNAAEATIRAEAAYAAMSRLLAVAGHDLKQPLQVALMAIEGVLQRSVDPAISERLNLATHALQRLGSELDDLARSSQRGLEPTVVLQSVPLPKFFLDLDTHWRGYAQASGITVRLKPQSLMVETDPIMLAVILRNLVGNAIKYSGRGGSVLVGCRRRGGTVVIEVHDRGYGIPASRFATIFDAFDRGGQEHTEQGLGLGLAIVQQTAMVLDHPITVKSIEGVGSTFSVTVPIAAPAYEPRNVGVYAYQTRKLDECVCPH
ncbi:sensor histidine kinase [Methylobacterium sp. CM6247]